MKILVANGGNEFAKNSEGQVPKDLVEDVHEEAATTVQLFPVVASAPPSDNATEKPSDDVDLSGSPPSKLTESKFLVGFGKENDTDPVVSQVLLRVINTNNCVRVTNPAHNALAASRFTCAEQQVQVMRCNCYGC